MSFDDTPGFDIYAATAELTADLRNNGHGEWAGRLHDAVTTGSTGTEILMAVRWVVRQIKNDVVGLTSKEREKIDRIVAEINRSLL